MRTAVILAGLAGLAGLAVSASAAADSASNSPASYRELVRGELAALAALQADTDQHLEAGDAEADKVADLSNEQFRNYAVSTPSVDPSNGFTAAERAAVVVNTSVAGAAAGVNISPFALAGVRALRGLSFTVAALDDTVTRIGAGYVYEHRRDPRFDELGIACKIDLAQASKLLDDMESAYLRACEVVAKIDEIPACQGRSPSCATLVVAGRLACDLPVKNNPSKLVAPRTVTQAAASITGMLDAIDADAKPELTDRQREALAALAGFKSPRPLDCATPEDVANAVTRWVWDQQTIKVSLTGRLDLFPLTLGFNPEDLADFERKAGELRVDGLYSGRGLEVGFGVGWETERSDQGEPSVGRITPSFRISQVVGALDGQRLIDGAGKLRLLGDGTLPPIVVIGVEGTLEIATEAVENDSSKLRAMTITPHIDFRYNADLAFRLGVPIAMKRIASSMDPTSVGSQWTIPVFIATMLTL
jgi:hypothetical protein